MNFLPIDKYLIIFPNTLRGKIYLKQTPALEVIELEFTIVPTNASLTGYGDGTHANTAGYSEIAGNPYMRHNFF